MVPSAVSVVTVVLLEISVANELVAVCIDDVHSVAGGGGVGGIAGGVAVGIGGVAIGG